METTVSTPKTVRMVTEGQVSFRNLRVNSEDKSFKIEFAFREDKRMKFDYQSVSGNITPELYEWFTKPLLRPNLEGDLSKPTETSPFKEWLDRKGIMFRKYMLRHNNELEFLCDNRSENFDDCPFRLTVSEKYGTATLNLVYKHPKVVVARHYNPDTGKFQNEYGYWKYANMKKDNFRRLEIITNSTV